VTEVRARIGLWGDASSGKTTMLAALPLAASQFSGQSSWTVSGNDPRSDSLLNEMRGQLERGFFPPATRGTRELHLVLEGHRKGRDPATIDLDMLDVEGAIFKREVGLDGPAPGQQVAFDDDQRNRDDRERLVNHLTTCDGIIMLFDPVREESARDSHLAVNGMLNTLLGRTRHARRLRGGRLPHFLTICVTKLDDPTVLFKALNATDLADLAKAPRPVINKRIARAYFRELCDRGHGGAAYMRNAIATTFADDRVDFCATSAVGFYVEPGRRFTSRDFLNVTTDETGRPRIRGQVTPMNVVEPFIEMAELIYRSRPAVPLRRP